MKVEIEWIPVTEQPHPTNRRFVVTTDSGHVVPLSQWSFVTMHDGSRKHFMPFRIVAWAEMPAPYNPDITTKEPDHG